MGGRQRHGEADPFFAETRSGGEICKKGYLPGLNLHCGKTLLCAE
jgi:hypothetical protein